MGNRNFLDKNMFNFSLQNKTKLQVRKIFN